jgi:hypothetical protein
MKEQDKIYKDLMDMPRIIANGFISSDHEFINTCHIHRYFQHSLREYESTNEQAQSAQ